MKYNNFKVLMLVLCQSFIVESKHGKLKKQLEKLEDFFVSDACRMRQHKITSDRNEEFELVESILNSTLTLACHFCDEPDNDEPKIWYQQSRFKETNITEVELGMDDELASNRLYMRPDHTLVFNRTIEQDAALYYCSGRLGENKNYKLNYLVDFIDLSKVKLIIGDDIGYANYLETAFVEINEKFASSNRSDFEHIRSRGILIEAISMWKPWGSCDGCKKTRMKIAECRLQPSLNDRNITWINSLNDNETFLIKSFEMSCFSLGLKQFYPNIAKDLLELGIYATEAPCYAPCKVGLGSKSSPRYRNTLTLVEGDHFTLVCPETKFKSNEVIWKKNDVAISPDIRGGNVIVDAFSNLYIISATIDEQANYTCFVGEVRMQEISVFVHKKSVITSKAFFRHFQYLGFIFLFSGIFYFAGMILAWNRRHTFKKVDFDSLAKESLSRYLPGHQSNLY